MSCSRQSTARSCCLGKSGGTGQCIRELAQRKECQVEEGPLDARSCVHADADINPAEVFGGGGERVLKGHSSRHFDARRDSANTVVLWPPLANAWRWWVALPQVRGCGRVRFFDGEPFFEGATFSDGTVTAKTFSV